MDLLTLAITFWRGEITSIVLMVVGFGLVIFVHELGHFIVAKAVGIRVQEFALGFGKRLWSFRRKETEYRLNMLPLGGYIKMLGQDDFHIKDQEQADPRAYNNRPIWARVCVVSAGVVMNVILAAVLFMIVFTAGIRFMPAEIGGVEPGYPADMVELPNDLGRGLQAGDQIMAINGKPIIKYSSLHLASTLSDEGETFNMLVRRPGVTEPFEVRVGTEGLRTTTGAIRHVFGLAMPVSRVLAAPELLAAVGEEKLLAGDTIVSFAGTPIEHGWQIAHIERTLTSKTTEIVVERTDDQTGETSRHTVQVRPHLYWSHQARREFQLDTKSAGDPTPFHVLGLQPRMRVWEVEPGGPADRAGLKPGDIIDSYGEAGETPTIRRFRAISSDYVGREAPISVLRGQRLAEVKAIGVERKGDDALVGIASVYDDAHLVVANVIEGSPFDGKIPSGASVTAISGRAIETWSDLIDAAADAQRAGEPVTLTYTTPAGGQRSTDPVDLAAFQVERTHYAHRFALVQKLLEGPEIRRGPLGAMTLGVKETRDFILLTYATLRQYFKGRVSGKEFSGPVGIFRAGVKIGSQGVIRLVWLLAIISANLAVINFLPLPILDGGLIVLLAIEKIRRRPLSIAVQNAVQVAGLVMIGVVFVLLTYNDIAQWLQSR